MTITMMRKNYGKEKRLRIMGREGKDEGE